MDKRWISLPGEGGHVDFAPNSEEEAMILEILRAESGVFHSERVLSGRGWGEIFTGRLLSPTTVCRRICARRYYRTRHGG